LRDRHIACFDYAQSANPPVLHRKEESLRPDNEQFEKFARLTTQEEKAGLLDETSSIGTRAGWQSRRGCARLSVERPSPGEGNRDLIPHDADDESKILAALAAAWKFAGEN
jgi:hypothetical protein